MFCSLFLKELSTKYNFLSLSFHFGVMNLKVNLVISTFIAPMAGQPFHGIGCIQVSTAWEEQSQLRKDITLDLWVTKDREESGA